MVDETIAEQCERHGAITRVARQLGIGTRGWLVSLGAVCLGAVIAGCLPSPPPSISPTSSAASTSPQVSLPQTATPEPSASLLGRIRIDTLPEVQLDAGVVTGLCDGEPGNGEPTSSSLECLDALQLGLRAIRSVTERRVERLYVHRPVCASGSCSENVVSTGTVVGWFEEGDSLSVDLDTRLDSVGWPAASPAVAWPQPDSTDAPPVAVGKIVFAPSEVAKRAPYPFCGDQSRDETDAKLHCFLDQLLLGKQVEVIVRPPTIEGGEVIQLYRFADHGAVISYQKAEGVWVRQTGGVLLGGADGYWSFDPWSPEEVIR